MEQGFVIKKETMIKKNTHNISDVYDMDQAVSTLNFW